MTERPSLSTVRLDVWLDVSCLYRTRAEAQRACHGGKVEIGGQRAKAHRSVRVGDEIRLTRGPGRRQVVVVTGLADRHIPKADARALYQDTTPPPTPEQAAALELERFLWKQRKPVSRAAPDRRVRRERRRAKEDGL